MPSTYTGTHTERESLTVDHPSIVLPTLVSAASYTQILCAERLFLKPLSSWNIFYHNMPTEEPMSNEDLQAESIIQSLH